MIKVDGDFYPCCKRYYFHSLHNAKCRKANGFTEDTDIHYADALMESYKRTAQIIEETNVKQMKLFENEQKNTQ